MQTQLNLAFGLNTTPVVRLHRGKIYIYSPTSGSGSSVLITDITLFAAIGIISIEQSSAGVTYGYMEPGHVFQNSSLVEFPALPIVGDIYECITVG
jgi:hypothetical protein